MVDIAKLLMAILYIGCFAHTLFAVENKAVDWIFDNYEGVIPRVILGVLLWLCVLAISFVLPGLLIKFLWGTHA